MTRGTLLLTVGWFFIALASHQGPAITQLGPFRSQAECEAKRAAFTGMVPGATFSLPCWDTGPTVVTGSNGQTWTVTRP